MVQRCSCEIQSRNRSEVSGGLRERRIERELRSVVCAEQHRIEARTSTTTKTKLNKKEGKKTFHLYHSWVHPFFEAICLACKRLAWCASWRRELESFMWTKSIDGGHEGVECIHSYSHLLFFLHSRQLMPPRRGYFQLKE